MILGFIGINFVIYVGYIVVLNVGYNESWVIFGFCIVIFVVVFLLFILMVIISWFFLKY